MAVSVEKLLLLGGLLSLLHAAYSAAQHRNYLRLTEREFTTLPIDILLQCVVSLVVTCYGAIHSLAKFKEIRPSGAVETKSWENFCNRTAFYSFSHRGQKLFALDDEET